jgi:hypothetical protein
MNEIYCTFLKVDEETLPVREIHELPLQKYVIYGGGA